MRNETNGWRAFPSFCRRHTCIDHAALADSGIVNTYCLQFIYQQLGKLQLLFAGRSSCTVTHRLRINRDISQKTLQNARAVFRHHAIHSLATESIAKIKYIYITKIY